MARIPKLFPEPDHEPEKTAARTYEAIRSGVDPFRGKTVEFVQTAEGGTTARVTDNPDQDPWWAPDGEYPAFIEPGLHEMYDRVFKRDRGRAVPPSGQTDPA
jgi:hypothetical protein